MTVLWLPAVLSVGLAEIPQWSPMAWGFVAASALVHLAYFNALLAGYRAADMTIVYPVARGSGPLLSSLAAVLLLGEHLGLGGGLGLAGVVGGILLMAAGPTFFSKGAAADPELHRKRKLGIAWGALTGATIATYSVLDGYAVKVLALSPVLPYSAFLPYLWATTAIGISILLFFLARIVLFTRSKVALPWTGSSDMSTRGLFEFRIGRAGAPSPPGQPGASAPRGRPTRGRALERGPVEWRRPLHEGVRSGNRGASPAFQRLSTGVRCPVRGRAYAPDARALA